MGFINLLKNGYRGKLGETVGQKWKDQLTVRTYQGTNNSKSPAQLDQRAHYKTLIQEAAAYYPFFTTSERLQIKGMNKFNLFTQFWDKSDGGLNPLYPKNPYFKTPEPSDIPFLSQYTSTAIYFGVPFSGPTRVDGLKSIGYTFLLNPNQTGNGNLPSEFYLDQIRIQKAAWRLGGSGIIWQCSTVMIPGKNINAPTGLRQIIAITNDKKRYSAVLPIGDPLMTLPGNYQIIFN